MTQERFEKMRRLNEMIKRLEQTMSHVDHSCMEMRLSDSDQTHESCKDMLESYYWFIPNEERNKLTTEMRERLKAALTQHINELKAEFEAL